MCQNIIFATARRKCFVSCVALLVSKVDTTMVNYAHIWLTLLFYIYHTMCWENVSKTCWYLCYYARFTFWYVKIWYKNPCYMFYHFNTFKCFEQIWPYHYTLRFNEVERGYTDFTLSVRPSVRPSVDRIVSALYLQQYSSDPFHFCTSFQATSKGVSRVKVVSIFTNLIFWQIL